MGSDVLAGRLPAQAERQKRRYWIDDWRPEDKEFWDGGGDKVARRNLIFSIFSEHIGFSIWTLWAVFVLFMGPGYGFDPGQKFLLTAAPAAVGAMLRLPYTFAVARFGGRNWTIFAALMLLVPAVTAAFVLEPGVSFSTVLIVALLAGVGGGNFASSMANINAFYPERLKGWALGLNAGGGNLGVPIALLVGLLVLATAGAAQPRLILAVYIPLIAVSALCAAFFMNNLTHAKNDKRALRDAVKDPHSWVMSFLYIGTFGSFIGFSFAFGQVLLVQFGETFDTPVKAAYVTFLGPLLGSLIRPVGGKLADRFGGARVTFANFVGMGLAATLVLVASLQHSLPLFMVGFLSLFVFAGIGNGSTYKMIPSIFRAKARRRAMAGEVEDNDTVDHEARRLSGGLIGLTGAIGALGGVFVNLAFRESFLSTGEGNAAYVAFIALYVACFALTWLVYLRPSSRRLAGV
jgi:MFS transporter, NNP family, nitrate/nitrite transporter